MRAIWKGAISFGLVTIPVRLYSATEEKGVPLHQVRRSDASRIRYRRVAEADGQEVEYADIARGYELPSGETVVLTEQDLDSLPLVTSRTVDVVGFVPLEQVDPIYFAKSYYLEPEGTGVKPYVLLRDALAQSARVALVKIALRQRETLATLRVRDGVFVLETMLWPDEVRVPDFPFLSDQVSARPQELAMAGSLIDSLSLDFEPEQYTDAYREALEAVVAAKVEGHEVIAPPGAAAETGGAVVDLMAALRASVEAARQARGDAAGAPLRSTESRSTGQRSTGQRSAGTRRAAKDLPAKDLPAKDLPVKDLPAKALPAKDKPAKDKPAKDKPAKPHRDAAGPAAAKRASRKSA